MLLAGVVVIAMLLLGAGPSISAVGRAQTGYPTMTPCIDQGDEGEYESCRSMQDGERTATAGALTATSMSLTATASAYPDPATATSGPTSTRQSSTASTPTLTATATSSASEQATGTAGSIGTAQTATLAVPDVSARSLAPPTETPTATPSSDLTCVPGVPIEIGGEGPPRAAYLLYFGQRAVGGGTVEQNGTFVAKLIVGQERAGTYEVTVRVRGTEQVLRQLTCSVPELTPTPVADLGYRNLR